MAKNLDDIQIFEIKIGGTKTCEPYKKRKATSPPEGKVTDWI